MIVGLRGQREADSSSGGSTTMQTSCGIVNIASAAVPYEKAIADWMRSTVTERCPQPPTRRSVQSGSAVRRLRHRQN
jgi:hypothetical protein